MVKTNLLLASAAWLVPASAGAAILFSDPGGPYAEMLHNDHAPAGQTVTLRSAQHGDLVDLLSPSTLDPNGNGFAKVDGPFSEITINPQDPLLGFSKIGFTLDPVAKYGKSQLFDYAFKVDLTFVGGGFQTLSSGLFPSDQKFDIWQQPGDTGAISSVRIYGLSGYTTETQTGSVCTPDKKGGLKCKPTSYDVDVVHDGLAFDDIRHVSYEGLYASKAPIDGDAGVGASNPVPEPSTWTMMIMGFGALGAALRRRRAATGAAA